MFETATEAGICRLGRPSARWLATGWSGGYRDADAAYNVSVPTGFERTDLAAYADERLAEAGFDRDGPTPLYGSQPPARTRREAAIHPGGHGIPAPSGH